MNMTQIDPAMARRVWQRVKGEVECQSELQKLMEDLWEDGNIYRQLARKRKGKRGSQYGLLYRQSMEQLRLLKGICALIQKCDSVFSPVPQKKEPEGILLRRCYGRALQRLSWYAANEADPQFGRMLPTLIRQTQSNSRLLLEMMSGANGR